MVQVEHTSLLDRHQYSNIALDFRHLRFSGTKGYPIFTLGHHVPKLGHMPSGSQYLTEDMQPSIHSLILNERNCNHFQLFHTEMRTMRTLSLGIQHPILISLYCGICCYPQFVDFIFFSQPARLHNEVQKPVKWKEQSKVEGEMAQKDPASFWHKQKKQGCYWYLHPWSPQSATWKSKFASPIHTTLQGAVTDLWRICSVFSRLAIYPN